MSNKVERITVSVESHLLARFEKYLSSNGYPTRSEAIKSLMGKLL
jgi:metal-responsive CopG/Arc/MetJ family transcriptional regulator